jgi:hypothetical protein
MEGNKAKGKRKNEKGKTEIGVLHPFFLFPFSFFAGLALASIATCLALFAADLAAAPWLGHADLLFLRVIGASTVEIIDRFLMRPAMPQR